LSRNLDPGDLRVSLEKLLLIVSSRALLLLGAGAGLVLLAKFGDFPTSRARYGHSPQIFDRTTALGGSTSKAERGPSRDPDSQRFVREDANSSNTRRGYFAMSRIKDVRRGTPGTSTITQQTVNPFLTPEKSIGRN